MWFFSITASATWKCWIFVSEMEATMQWPVFIYKPFLLRQQGNNKISSFLLSDTNGISTFPVFPALCLCHAWCSCMLNCCPSCQRGSPESRGGVESLAKGQHQSCLLVEFWTAISYMPGLFSFSHLLGMGNAGELMLASSGQCWPLLFLWLCILYHTGP